MVILAVFSSIDDLVEIPEVNDRLNLGTGDFTIEATFKSNIANFDENHQVIVSKRTWAAASEADGFLFGIWGETGRLFIQMKGTPNIMNYSSPSVLDGNCHHVAVRRLNGVITFFIDGISVGDGDFMSTRDISSEGSLRFGFNHVSELPFNGYFKEVRIWNIARTNTQIYSSMNNLSAPSSNLRGWWVMNDLMTNKYVSDISTSNVSLKNNGFLGSQIEADDKDPIWISSCINVCNPQNNLKTLTSVIEEEDISTIFQPEFVDYNSEIEIYPNPFSDGLSIIISNNIVLPIKVEIINSLGIQLRKLELYTSQSIINTEELIPDIYFVIFETPTQRKIFKIVKFK